VPGTGPSRASPYPEHQSRCGLRSSGPRPRPEVGPGTAVTDAASSSLRGRPLRRRGGLLVGGPLPSPAAPTRLISFAPRRRREDRRVVVESSRRCLSNRESSILARISFVVLLSLGGGRAHSRIPSAARITRTIPYDLRGPRVQSLIQLTLVYGLPVRREGPNCDHLSLDGAIFSPNLSEIERQSRACAALYSACKFCRNTGAEGESSENKRRGERERERERERWETRRVAVHQ
jgi:hypothetical protein